MAPGQKSTDTLLDKQSPKASTSTSRVDQKTHPPATGWVRNTDLFRAGLGRWKGKSAAVRHGVLRELSQVSCDVTHFTLLSEMACFQRPMESSEV